MKPLTAARVLVPVKIVPAMIGAGTSVPEPNIANGEVAWVAGAAYVVDDLRTYNGSVWSCVRDHTGRATPPETEAPGYWLRKGPTDRMAPFDDYVSTKARGTGTLTFVVMPGFANGVKVYGPEGAAYSIVARDGPGGPILKSVAGDLYAQAAGFYELLYQPLRALDQFGMDGIPLALNVEYTITITSPGGGAVAVGVIKVGDWRQLIGDSKWGGVVPGAESQRKTYTYRDYKPDGTYTQTVRPARSRDVTCRVVLDARQAMYADAVLDEIADVAVPFEATGLPHLGYLNTLCFLSGSIRADDYGGASLSLNAKGNI